MEAGHPGSGRQQSQVVVRAPFWAVGCQLLIGSSRGGERREESCRVTLTGHRPIQEGSALILPAFARCTS